ncbi:MAG TPA: hypothetical protein VMU38_10820 [Candidatus Binatia bacterium]|nr:hypothetical protein [Candidatus Binatia bacterium]
MKGLGLIRYAVTIGVVVASLAGCSGSQPGMAGGIPRAADAAQRPATSGPLLYAADILTGNVNVFTYPQAQLAFTLSGFVFPSGECVDKQGDVFILSEPTVQSGMVTEYTHGGTTPIGTLSDPGVPLGCSVDPTTNNLAVTNSNDVVAVYEGAQGMPTTYAPDIPYLGYCAYDNAGNLYIDGWDNYERFVLSVLRSGSNAFSSVSLSVTISRDSGALQFDSNNLVVASDPQHNGPGALLSVRVSNGVGTIVGTTRLKPGGPHRDFGGPIWIENRRVLQPVHSSVDIGIWDYPRGGKTVQTIDQAGHAIAGLVISR